MNFINFIWIMTAYLSGSLCSAIIVCRLCGLGDPRRKGSKNPGATNVLRLHGKKYAALVLLGDMLKATIPLVVAHRFVSSYELLAWMGLSAVLGHVFPIFFRFKGGKGVATALGVYFGLAWVLGVMVVGVWILVAYLKRYSSLASLISMSFAPFVACWLLESPQMLLPLLSLAILIIAMHHANLLRLFNGQESKLKF